MEKNPVLAKIKQFTSQLEKKAGEIQNQSFLGFLIVMPCVLAASIAIWFCLAIPFVLWLFYQNMLVIVDLIKGRTPLD